MTPCDCRPPFEFPVWQCPKCGVVWVSEMCVLQCRTDRERYALQCAIRDEFMTRVGRGFIYTRTYL